MEQYQTKILTRKWVWRSQGHTLVHTHNISHMFIYWMPWITTKYPIPLPVTECVMSLSYQFVSVATLSSSSLQKLLQEIKSSRANNQEGLLKCKIKIHVIIHMHTSYITSIHTFCFCFKPYPTSFYHLFLTVTMFTCN